MKTKQNERKYHRHNDRVFNDVFVMNITVFNFADAIGSGTVALNSGGALSFTNFFVCLDIHANKRTLI